METKQKSVSFSYGIRRTPSLGEPGELSDCVNIIPKEGEMVNLLPPKSLSIELGTDETLKAVHSNSSFKEAHYIVLNGNELKWFTKKELNRKPLFTIPSDANLIKVDIIGNTLVILLTTGIEYILFKDGEYVQLGYNVPEVGIKLALDGAFEFSPTDYSTKLVTSSSEKTFTDPAFEGHSTFSGYYVPHGREGAQLVIVDFSALKEEKLTRGTYRFYNYSSNTVKYVLVSGTSAMNFSIEPQKYKDVSVSRNCNRMELSFKSDIWGTITVGVFKQDSQGRQYKVSNEPDNVNMVLGVAAEYIKEATSKDHKFVSPFFARTAIKLYDGTVVHQSVPCLLIPSSEFAPAVLFDYSSDSDKAIMFTAGMKCDLQYKISDADLQKLELWKDIITSVSFSVTKPIYLYDQDPEVGEGKFPLKTDVISSGRPSSGVPNTSLGYSVCNACAIEGNNFTEGYKTWYLAEMLETKSYSLIRLPEVKKDSLNFKPAEFDNFYTIKDVKIDELISGEYTTLDLENVNLFSVEALTVLEDDNCTHDRVIPSISYIFNSRLNIGNIRQKLWQGCQLDEFGGKEDSTSDDLCSAKMVLHLSINGLSHEVGSSELIDLGNSACNFRWLYYPRKKVSKATIYLKRGGGYYKSTVVFKDHPFMRGSYWFNDFAPLEFESCEQSEAEAKIDVTYEEKKNSVFTSVVNNPFVFPEVLKNDIADGELLALTSAVKALNTGQFGQQPMYAFMTTGIWALHPNGQGAWEAVQPVNRDVLSQYDSLVQLDDSVIFATKQGLKLLSGSVSQLISGKIEGFNLSEDFYESKLPADLKAEDSEQFRNLVQNAKCCYDYVNRLVHIFIPGSNSHYVFSLESQEFVRQVLPSTYGELKSIVHGYPFTTLQFGNNLYEYDTFANDERLGVHKGYLMTRIYAFDDPFARKALMDLRTFGQTVTPESGCSVVVYVSDDKKNWSRLTSLKMKSAKFFRFLIKTFMTDLDTLSGMVLSYQERFTHKIR